MRSRSTQAASPQLEMLAISNRWAKVWTEFRHHSRCVRRFRNGDLSEPTNFAIIRGAFVDSETEIFRNQRFDAVEEEVVELGAGLAADFDGIFETGGGNQSRARAFAFEQGVGADGGAMQKNEFALVIDFAEGFDDGLRGIGGSGEDFQHAQAAGGLDPDTVGEGAAGIDGDAE